MCRVSLFFCPTGYRVAEAAADINQVTAAAVVVATNDLVAFY